MDIALRLPKAVAKNSQITFVTTGFRASERIAKPLLGMAVVNGLTLSEILGQLHRVTYRTIHILGSHDSAGGIHGITIVLSSKLSK